MSTTVLLSLLLSGSSFGLGWTLSEWRHLVRRRRVQRAELAELERAAAAWAEADPAG